MHIEQKTSRLNSENIASSGKKRSTGFRSLLVIVCVAGLGWIGWSMLDRMLADRSPVIVGILHSQTGAMAVSEKTMVDAEILALEEINAQGGLLGRPVEWVIADGAARTAESLN